jgi:hypothetical protein
MKLENTVIKAKNKTHAKKIVKWFKSQGADMDFFNEVTLFPNESDGGLWPYYGILGGRFEYWSKSSVIRTKANIIELPEDTISKSVNEPVLNVIL